DASTCGWAGNCEEWHDGLKCALIRRGRSRTDGGCSGWWRTRRRRSRYATSSSTAGGRLLTWSRIPRRRRTESTATTAAPLKHRDDWREITRAHELAQHPGHRRVGAGLVERIEHEDDAVHLQRRVT